MINDGGRVKLRMAETMAVGHLLFQSFISGPLFWPFILALYSGPLFPALYFSLLFKPSPAEEAQQEDGAAETEFDAHGGPDALEAERGG